MKFQKLFWDPNFDNILNALEGTGQTGNKKTDFDNATKACPWMTAEEGAWLWNYLQNYKKSGTGTWNTANVLEAAAGTGW